MADYKEIFVLFKGGDHGLHVQADPMFDEEAGILVLSGGEDSTTTITANFDNIAYFSVSPLVEDDDDSYA